MPTARAEGTPPPGARSLPTRSTWADRLRLAVLTLLVVVALVAMEVFSLLLLDLVR